MRASGASGRRAGWSLLLLITGLVLAWQRHQASPIGPLRFLLPPAPHGDPGPRAAPWQLDLPAGAALAHAPALLLQRDGSLLVAWFAGSREAADDVVLRQALIRERRLASTWQALSRQQLQQQLQRSIRTLGNPVLWQRPDGHLGLALVSVSYGRWSGSAINLLRSRDGGRHWGEARRLITSPLFNVSTLVRSPVLPLEDGGLLLPAYHELIHYWPLSLRLNRAGTLVAAEALPVRSTSQPAVVAVAATTAIAWLRDHRPDRRRLLLSRGAVAGGQLRWGAAAEGGWPNPNSAVAALRRRNGQVLVALNPQAAGREQLDLLRWHPQRRTLERLQRLEPDASAGGGAEPAAYGYPALAEAADGGLWVAYSVNKRFIRLRYLPEPGRGGGRR